ncbi:MAG: AsmA family protein, partial [Armatimonadetes bacterium]|nr:AsmA family protein [Armatimonadota bacterium]
MRKLARLLPYLVILVLLVVAAIVLLQTGPLAERLRKSVAEEFSHQLGREVSIGKASLTVSGRVVLREVVVKNEDGSVLLNAPKVEAWVGSEGSLIPLLSKPTQVRAVRLTGPEVNLTRASGGEWSISDLLARR